MARVLGHVEGHAVTSLISCLLSWAQNRQIIKSCANIRVPAAGLKKKKYFLRMITALAHYSDTRSVVPPGNIYNIYSLTFYLTFFVAFYLASILTFFLSSILAFYLASSLTWVLPSILTFFLASMTFFLPFYLASILTFFLAVCLPFVWHSLLAFSLLRSKPHGDRDIRSGSRRSPQVEARDMRFGDKLRRGSQEEREGLEEGGVAPFVKTKNLETVTWQGGKYS